MLTRRSLAEVELARALDRHIGYTTGAFGLGRIAEVTVMFEGRGTLLVGEIVHRLRKTHAVRERYAGGILDFAVGLGLVQRFGSTGLAARVGLTDLGRAYRGAQHCGSERLKQLILTYAVLAADCDLYGLLLESFTSNGGSDVVEVLRERLRLLRERRLEWLRRFVPDRTLRRRITDRVRWLQRAEGEGGDSSLGVEVDFARHHTTPRKKWAETLGHIHSLGQATEFGEEVLGRIHDDDGSYFWIGPSPSTVRDLRLPREAERKPLGPVWNLLRPSVPSQDPPDREVRKLAEFMEEVYPAIRLMQANQASTDAVLPFLYLQERDAGSRYDEESFLRRLFLDHRSRLAPMSKRFGLIGHYQVRAK